MSSEISLPHLLLENSSDNAQSPSEGCNKAVAWARVSTDMQDERGLSMPEQLREIRQYATKNDLEIVAEFSEATSAFRHEERRVEFIKMLAFVRADKQITAILVHDFSRFSRDSVRGKSLFRALKDEGIQVRSVTDPGFDPETASGVWMEAVTFAKNEAYSREIAFHTRKGCRANVQTRDPETGLCYKNGGQPLFGYKSVQLIRGEQHRGKPVIKSVWELDDTMVNGKAMHEWAREVLLMAKEGASLDRIRDFLNDNGVPGRRNAYWGLSTCWSLLEHYKILKYCGYDFYNIHMKQGKARPLEDWVIVENAHPAIITEEEAQAIIATRKKKKSERFDTGCVRSRTSEYLLSGGLFICERCGSNMTGIHTTSEYYVCGSRPYRKGLGCGPGVYVPKAWIEDMVTQQIAFMLEQALPDLQALTREVNAQLRARWERETGHDGTLVKRITEIARRIEKARKMMIDDELTEEDVRYAKERLRELQIEREGLMAQPIPTEPPPQIDVKTMLEYRNNLEKAMNSGEPEERKAWLRKVVQQIALNPETLRVRITLRLPGSLMQQLVAGEGARTRPKASNQTGLHAHPFSPILSDKMSLSVPWRQPVVMPDGHYG